MIETSTTEAFGMKAWGTMTKLGPEVEVMAVFF